MGIKVVQEEEERAIGVAFAIASQPSAERLISAASFRVNSPSRVCPGARPKAALRRSRSDPDPPDDQPAQSGAPQQIDRREDVILVISETTIQAILRCAEGRIRDEAGCLVATTAEVFGQGRISIVERPVGTNAQFPGPAAGEHARVRGKRPGCRGDRPVEVGPLAGESRQARRGVERIAMQTRGVGTDGVHDDRARRSAPRRSTACGARAMRGHPGLAERDRPTSTRGRATGAACSGGRIRRKPTDRFRIAGPIQAARPTARIRQERGPHPGIASKRRQQRNRPQHEHWPGPGRPSGAARPASRAGDPPSPTISMSATGVIQSTWKLLRYMPTLCELDLRQDQASSIKPASSPAQSPTPASRGHARTRGLLRVGGRPSPPIRVGQVIPSFPLRIVPGRSAR